ncbi:MAG TPA: ELWxxDGT repeat protein [Thermoanaerobaculia bacterium]|nr:ELWxxDGT repeat protein [Thermoanaerobaculia bacterium]
MKSVAVCCLLVLLALPAAGLEPYLVKDINAVSSPDGSDPLNPVTFRGAVLFFANDGISGGELWRSDGTAAGTFQLSDASGELGDPQPYAVTEQLYFFVSGNPIAGFASLWVSDGTPAGTFRLTDPDVAVVGRPRVWIASQGILYFTGRDTEHGIELWRTDGTPAGTHLVADVRPGPEPSNISGLTEYKGQAWFGADDGQHGGSLWRSDGTAAGTVLAVDPFPASASNESPEFVQAVGSRITFFVRPPSEEPGPIQELWGGDGTAGGTARISAGKTIYDRIVRGNRLYFIGESRKGQELWVSDGTRPGTRPLTNFPKFDAFESQASLPREGLNDGRFLFWANDGTHGAEPWITDGTPGGTRLLRDLCPGECSTFGATWLLFRGRLYFITQENGYELWSTNGTRAGTRRVSGACPGNCLFSLHSPFVAGDRLLFVARDAQNGEEIWSTNGKEIVRVTDFENPNIWEEEGLHGAVLGGVLFFRGEDGQHGAELWRTDGTVAGTALVEDINQIDIGGSFPRGLMALGDEVVFVVLQDSAAPELWKSDGTAAGTVRFRTFEPDELDGARPVGASAEAGGLLFYFGYELGDSYVPWRTDGTAAGTFRLTEEAVPSCCSPAREIEAVGSLVFFELQDEEHGRELWVSDGTREGTRLVLDIVPGPVTSVPRELTAFQGLLFFTAGVDLWKSDGTAAGTVPFTDLEAGGEFALPVLFTVHAGRLWFFADDGEHGRELWSSDGTEAGTRLEVEFKPGSGSTEALFMASLGDRFIISIYGEGLWVTDGTPAGTRKIHDRDFDPSTYPEVVFQGRLYYVSAATGTIWMTDGTEAGTGPLLDHEGNQIFSPGQFAILGDRLVFIAPDLFGLATLWESDGTPAGTFQVEPRVKIGGELVRAGNLVFFSSYNISTGWELWAVKE